MVVLKHVLYKIQGSELGMTGLIFIVIICLAFPNFPTNYVYLLISGFFNQMFFLAFLGRLPQAPT